MLKSQEILHLVNDYIDHLPFDRTPSGLYEPIRYVLSLGGKRIRPVLMMLVYNMYKDNPEAILEQACALETYHNYTLLHDDLMDNADVRRGKPTVHKRWNPNTAILSGDSIHTNSTPDRRRSTIRHGLRTSKRRNRSRVYRDDTT